jgi:hypothetical protein
MTDASTITAIFVGLTTLLSAGNALMIKRAEARRREAEAALLSEAAAVRRDTANNRLLLQVKLQGVIATLERIHSDGNGSLSNALRLLARAERRNADKSGNAEDLALALKAEARADAHDEVQADIAKRQVLAEEEYTRLRKEIEAAANDSKS